jgi:hypothetical protein
MTGTPLKFDGTTKEIKATHKEIDVFCEEHHICVDRLFLPGSFSGRPALAPVRIVFGVILSPPR